MSRTEATETDRATAVIPPLNITSPWRVVAAEALSGLRLRLTFVDGTKGEAELASFLRADAVTGTVFEALRDEAFFKRARVVLGAVEWPNGADLAPDSMYDGIRQHGSWSPG